MESLVIFLILIVLAVIGTVRMERKAQAVSLTVEADAAIRSMRGVAQKRAERASIPIPPEHWEATGVTEIPPEMDRELKAIATRSTPALGVPAHSNGRPRTGG